MNRGKPSPPVVTGVGDFDQAYRQFAPVALAAARRFVRKARVDGWYLDQDDAAQIARLALWEAWQRDPRCGPGFLALVRTVVQRRLTNWLRRRVPMIRSRRGEGQGPRVYSLEHLAETDPEWETRVRSVGEEE